MSIAAPMLVISLIIYAGLFGLFIYLVRGAIDICTQALYN